MLTLSQVKNYLWITTNTSDVRLQAILDSTLEALTTYIGDYSHWEKTIKVKNTNLKNKIGLMHINLDTTMPFSLDWNIISDFIFLDSGEVEVNNLFEYITSEFSYSEVKYTAGYETTPSDIVWAVSEKVGFDFAKELGQVVAMEQMWPRSVEFFGNEKTSDNANKEFLKKMRHYIPSHLRIW